MTRGNAPDGGAAGGAGDRRHDPFGSRRSSKLRTCPFCTMPMRRHCGNPACRWISCQCGATIDPARGSALPPPRGEGG
jgi:hypothetical protein